MPTDYNVDLPIQKDIFSNGAESAVKGVAATTSSVTAIGFLINLPVAVTMMKLMQVIEYLVYIDINPPPELKRFL